MEILTAIVESNLETNEQADLQALIELSAHELSLVGGGTANVAFV